MCGNARLTRHNITHSKPMFGVVETHTYYKLGLVVINKHPSIYCTMPKLRMHACLHMATQLQTTPYIVSCFYSTFPVQTWKSRPITWLYHTRVPSMKTPAQCHIRIIFCSSLAHSETGASTAYRHALPVQPPTCSIVLPLYESITLVFPSVHLPPSEGRRDQPGCQSSFLAHSLTLVMCDPNQSSLAPRQVPPRELD